MSKVVLLDTGPLGMIVHPRPKPDMILCAQAALISNPEDEVIIATTNVGHLARFSQAMLWKDI
ncbi:MAG TPA: hypothetical protein VH599_15615 [Ktedonobacterales bacterium]|jgi:hypothetical protein